ncbi:hypothetical protein ACAF76_011320 [Brevibacillus sp. TJ4]|uniref:hypothetical protein n=1 Tax=Brevibacillus sp. TJ4 TaxID=3234853 RepID=UPI0037D38034
MSNFDQKETETGEQKPGKISLQEAIKRKLAEKKQSQANANASSFHQKATNQKMKSQNTKKPNNQRRRTGV